MLIVYKLFINIVAVFIYVSFIQVLYSVKTDKRIIFPYIAATGIVLELLLYLDRFLNLAFRTFISLAILIAFAYFILKQSLVRSIICSILFGIILAIGDMTVGLLLVKQYDYSITQIKNNMFLSVISDIIIYGTQIGIIFLLRFIMQTREMAHHYKKQMSYRTTFYMLLTFVVIVINISLFAQYVDVISSKLLLYYTIAIWIYFIVSLYMNFINSELAIKEQQYDQQQDYIKTIDYLVNDFRRLKHSHANTIYSIYGYIREKDWHGLEVYFGEIMDEAVRVDQNILLALQKIKVYSVFGLLWNKIAKAEALGIRLEVAVPNEVHSVGMKLSDLCEILGNYLDNAIEAVQMTTDRKLSVGFLDENGYLTIRIENGYEGSLDVNRIYEKGYSTRGNERGFGLSITKSLLTKYNNVLQNTIVENSRFIQELVIKK